MVYGLGENYRDNLRKSFASSVALKGREYRKVLALREPHEKFMSLLPDDLFKIPGVNIWQSTWGTYGVWVTIKYSKPIIDMTVKMLEDHGWTTDNKDLHTAEDNLYIYYYHPEVHVNFKVTVNIETPTEVQSNDGQVCVLVPIEWETQLVAKTYDRLCPEGHPELFDEDGKYIGDALFPAMPKEAK
ncbi:MAG: hypothetical protein ACW987_15530 [Candidatus Thorarchaeota archaeon]